MKNFTTKFDEELLDIGIDGDEPGFYSYFPQMLPWIGCEYESSRFKRLLIIGESHYLPDDADEDLLDPDIWYNQDHKDYYSVGEEIEQNTNTRTFVSLGHWSSRAHSIYREPERLIKNLITRNSKQTENETGNALRYVAYYNYFLRPAKKGQSIKQILIPPNNAEEMGVDEKYADDTFRELVGIIKPDFVYFLSKFAYDTYMKNNKTVYNFKSDYSPHPCCAWWNRKHINYHEKILSGKEKMIEFLVSNRVFE